MAKKRNIVINDQELTPTVLAVKADKKKTSVFSILWVVFIFAVFISSVIFLPDISVYVNNYLNPDYQGGSGNVSGTKPKDDEDVEKEEIKEYEIASNPEIVEKDFTLKNIKLENGKISFDIQNNSENVVNLDELNYFMNLYNGSKRLLQRIMIGGSINPNDSTNLQYDLEDEGVTHMSFVAITEEEYPAYVVNHNDSGNGTLACTKDYETINYLTLNNKLYAIQDIYNVPATDQNYAVLYSTYQALANTYNSIGGVTSNVTVQDNIMTFKTVISLNTLVNGTMSNKSIYPKDTDAKVMKFELESSGYTCR